MPINTISIHDYKTFLGANRGEHNQFRNELPQIIRNQVAELNIQDVDLYNLREEVHNNGAGSIGRRVCIFANATFTGEAPMVVNNVEDDEYFGFTRFIEPINKDTLIITSEGGLPIAEWSEKTHELNILFNIFKEYNQQSIDAFTHIMQKWNEQVWYVKSLQDSWKFTSDKDALTRSFTKKLEEQKERELRQAKEAIQTLENQIRDYARSIKTNSDSIGVKRRFVQVETENLKNVSLGLIQDLDLIINHPKVKDLKIKSGKFIVYTYPLIITSTKGKRYYGGEYRFELDPDQSDIRFFGNNTRRGLWTHNDPHPHVNGSDGHACLGNVSSTIAELSSQMQIYALALIGIDFLESANTDDSAGENVIRWDEVDENNIPIPKDQIQLYTCDDCSESVENLYTVFNYIDENDDLQGEHSVCQNCRDDAYHWDDDIEEYIKDVYKD